MTSIYLQIDTYAKVKIKWGSDKTPRRRQKHNISSRLKAEFDWKTIKLPIIAVSRTVALLAIINNPSIHNFQFYPCVKLQFESLVEKVVFTNCKHNSKTHTCESLSEKHTFDVDPKFVLYCCLDMSNSTWFDTSWVWKTSEWQNSALFISSETPLKDWFKP